MTIDVETCLLQNFQNSVVLFYEIITNLPATVSRPFDYQDLVFQLKVIQHHELHASSNLIQIIIIIIFV